MQSHKRTLLVSYDKKKFKSNFRFIFFKYRHQHIVHIHPFIISSEFLCMLFRVMLITLMLMMMTLYYLFLHIVDDDDDVINKCFSCEQHRLIFYHLQIHRKYLVCIRMPKLTIIVKQHGKYGAI